MSHWTITFQTHLLGSQEIFLQKLVEKSFQVGDVIIEEGKETSTFYMIKSGEVKVETIKRDGDCCSGLLGGGRWHAVYAGN